MPVTKPTPTFEVLFQGPQIYPWSIPLRKVADAFSAIKRLASGIVLGDDDEEEDEEEKGVEEPIRLLDVQKGSAVFRFIGSTPSLDRLKYAGDILERPETIGDSEYILRPVKDLTSIARSLNCSIVVREPGKDSPVLARISDASFKTLSKSLLIKGDTKIVGLVQRVGGATDIRCGLRVSFQKRMLFCRIESVDVARRLGDLLYQNVIASGTAKWFRHSMRLFSFVIKDISKPLHDSIFDSLKAVWDAGLNDWEKFDDPDAVLHEIKGDE